MSQRLWRAVGWTAALAALGALGVLIASFVLTGGVLFDLALR